MIGIGEYAVSGFDDQLKGWLHHHEQVPSVTEVEAMTRAVRWMQDGLWVDFASHYNPNVLEAMRTRWISPEFISTNRMGTAPEYGELLLDDAPRTAVFAQQPVVRFMNRYRAKPRRVADRLFVSCGVYEPLIVPNRSMVTAFEGAGNGRPLRRGARRAQLGELARPAAGRAVLDLPWSAEVLLRVSWYG